MVFKSVVTKIGVPRCYLCSRELKSIHRSAPIHFCTDCWIHRKGEIRDMKDKKNSHCIYLMKMKQCQLGHDTCKDCKDIVDERE